MNRFDRGFPVSGGDGRGKARHNGRTEGGGKGQRDVHQHTEFTGIDTPDRRVLFLRIALTFQDRVENTLVKHIGNIVDQCA